MRVLVFAVAVCLGSITLGADATVPFHASIDTVVTPTGPCGAACLALSISGSGQASHGGRTEIDGPSQINFQTGQQSGTSTLTTADGSTIVQAFTGTFIPTSQTDAVFQGTWTVIGGTGRFAGATGGGTYHGSAAGDNGILNLDGQLSNPGKKK